MGHVTVVFTSHIRLAASPVPRRTKEITPMTQRHIDTASMEVTSRITWIIFSPNHPKTMIDNSQSGRLVLETLRLCTKNYIKTSALTQIQHPKREVNISMNAKDNLSSQRLVNILVRRDLTVKNVENALSKRS